MCWEQGERRAERVPCLARTRAHLRMMRERVPLPAARPRVLETLNPGSGVEKLDPEGRFLVIHDARDGFSGPLRDVGPDTGFKTLRFAVRRDSPSRQSSAGGAVGPAQPLPVVLGVARTCSRNPLPPLRGHTPAGESLTLPPVASEGVFCVRMIMATEMEHAREQGRNRFSRSWNRNGTGSALFA